jgi:diguanylate cyclase (GGDEF)-like protein
MRLTVKRPRFSRTVQHGLGRGALLAGILAPLAALLLVIWFGRDQTITDLVSAQFPLFIILLIPVAVLIHYRQRILETIDRRFFKEEYDARRSLLRVVSLIQKGSDLQVLGRIALQEIEKALHPRHLSFWILEDGGRNYIRQLELGEPVSAPALSRNSELARFLNEQTEALDLSAPPDDPRLRAESTRDWLERANPSLVVPLFVEHEMTGFLLLGERLSEEGYTADSRDLMTTVAAQLALTEEYTRLEAIARKDPLTDVLNRHAFYSLLEKKKSSASLITSGSVALVDLNDLKRINDTFGHATGDYALRQVASAIRSLLRPDDLLFRWGGDEFLVIVFGLDEEVVRHRFSMLDAILGETLSTPSSDPIPITVAFGVARFGSVASLHAAIDQADKTMYAYKQARKSAAAYPEVRAQ